MDITHLGHFSFRIKGKNATVVTNPFETHDANKFPKHIAADIITMSQSDYKQSEVSVVEGESYIADGPGEYEVKGVGIIGIATNQGTIYRIEIDGVVVVHLGEVTEKLSERDVDALDGVDILLISVGTEAAKTGEIVSEIEPSIVIPMNYSKTSDATLTAFLKEFGDGTHVPQPKLSVTKDKIPEQLQVVVLE